MKKSFLFLFIISFLIVIPLVWAEISVFETSTDQMTISTDNTEAIRIDASQNVGINTDAPRQLLDVVGSVYVASNVGIGTDSPDSQVHVYSAAGGSQLRIGNDLTVVGRTSDIAFGTNATTDWSKIGSIVENSGDVGLAFYTTTNSASSTPEQMRINHEGNVSVGTTAPGLAGNGSTQMAGTILEVMEPSTFGRLVARGASGGGVLSLIDSDAGANEKTFAISSDGGLAEFQTILDNDSAVSVELMNIDLSSGNVGIGTTAPRQLLDVEGTVYMKGSVGINTTSTSALLHVEGTSEFSGVINTNSNWISGDGGAEGIIVNSSGQVGIGVSPTDDLTVAGPGDNVLVLYEDADNQGWLYWNEGTDTLRVYTEVGGTGKINAVFDNGNVGIGTEVPRELLDVEGTVYMKGNVGIATLTPVAELDVVGSIAIDSTACLSIDSGVIFHDTDCDGTQDGGEEDIGGAGGGSGDSIADADSDTQIQTEEGSDEDIIRFDTKGSERFVILSDGVIYSNGNVGIGTITPQTTLMLSGTDELLRLDDSDAGSDQVARAYTTYYRGGNANRLGYAGFSGEYRYEIATDFSQGFIRFRTGSNISAMTLDENQNVGIGTDAPRQTLDVEGSAYFQGNVGIAAVAPEAGLQVGTASPNYSLDSDDVFFASDLEVDGSFYFVGAVASHSSGDHTQGHRIRIHSTTDGTSWTKNTGIGGLIVTSDDSSGNPVARIDAIHSNSSLQGQADVGWLFSVSNNGTPSEVFEIDNDGNVIIESGNSLYLDGESNTYIQEVSADNIQFVTEATEAMRIARDNVGIGTTAPRETLDVEGTVYMKGNVGIATLTPVAELDVVGSIAIDSTACLSIDGGVIYHDTNCDGTQDGGEEDIGQAGGGGGGLWTDGGATTYLTSLTDNVGIGTSSADTPLEIEAKNTANNSITDMVTISKQVTNSPAVGLGAGIIFDLEDDDDLEEQASIDVAMLDTNSSSEDAYIAFNIMGGGSLAEKMRITGSGNVGIGTADPQAMLHVEEGAVRFADTTGTSAAINLMGTKSEIYHLESDSTQTARITMDSDGSGGATFAFEDIDGTDVTRVFINGNGNLGIGTTAPEAGFQVGDSASTLALDSDDAFFVSNIEVDGSVYIATNLGVGVTDPSEKLFVSGSSTVNPTFQSTNGQVYSIYEANTSGGSNVFGGFQVNRAGDSVASILARREGANDAASIHFDTQATGGSLTERMVIESAGNVGIGTDVPRQLLDVEGTVYMKGNVGINTTSPGEVLEINNIAVFSNEIDNGNSGAGTVNITWSNGGRQKVTITGAATLQFNDPGGVANVLLKIVNGGSAGFSFSNPGGSVYWPGGSGGLSWTASGTDIVSCYFDETDYYCTQSLDFQ